MIEADVTKLPFPQSELELGQQAVNKFGQLRGKDTDVISLWEQVFGRKG